MRIILLEHPREASPDHFNDIANTPLWSCLMTGYAGASLQKEGFETEMVDATRWSFAQTVQYLIGHPSDLLAVHAVYFWEKTERFFQMLADLRKQGYDIPICLYGFFPTLVWKDILNNVSEVDYVLVGEPEETLVAMAQCIQKGTRVQIEGLAVRDRGNAILSGMRPPSAPLDRLPFPLRPYLETEETVSVLASRGCSNRCSFCLIPTLNGRRSSWRGRSVENVVSEIGDLVTRGKKDFYFVDPNFVGPGKKGKERVLELASALSELNITFGMETRASDLTDSLMKSMVGAGLTSMLLGIESASSRVLERLGKNTSVTQNELAVAAVREAGLEPEIGFIMFDAASTLGDIDRNLSFLDRNGLLQRLGRTANLLYHDHIAFKGTAGYETALEQGMLIPEGLFGFEGRLLYRDPRVGWFAGVMKRTCQFLLIEMGNPLSPLYWSKESEQQEPFRAVNDQLVEIFKRLLRMAGSLSHIPGASQIEELLCELKDELQGTICQRKQ